MRKPWTTPTNQRKSNASFLSNHSPFAYSPLHYATQYSQEITNDEDDLFERETSSASLPLNSPQLYSFLKSQSKYYMEHMNYENAIYYGHLATHLTQYNTQDVLDLAKIYVLNGEYQRALFYLKRILKSQFNINALYLALASCCELKDWEQALAMIDPLSEDIISNEKDLHMVSNVYYLKGIVYQNVSNTASSIQAFKKAIMCDFANIAAFNALMENHMLTSAEEYEFYNSIQFDSSPQSEFLKHLFTLKLKRYGTATDNQISSSFHIFTSSKPFQQYKAEKNYLNCQFNDCLNLTSKILKKDPFSTEILPLHLSVLTELNEKLVLFQLAHQLVEHSPHSAVAWYGVGCYYLTVKKYDEARRYFAKSTSMDPLLAAAWTGFGHAFAIDGEHDQAISAYSTAARLFKGCHLPLLFIGMEHASTNNYVLAEQYAVESQTICPSDPTLYNELGVIYYEQKDYSRALHQLLKGKEMVKELPSQSDIYQSMYINLGHTYRCLKEYEKALQCFEIVLAHSPFCSVILTNIGLIYHLKQEYYKAIDLFHRALANKPDYSIASELLTRSIHAYQKPVEDSLTSPQGSPWVSVSRKTKKISSKEMEGIVFDAQ